MTVIQALINGIGALGRFIQMLPQSPFMWLEETMGVNPALDVVLWIIPAGQMLSLIQTWLSAILIYYAVKTPLRWAKLVN